MEIINENKVDRIQVKVANIQLARIKNYNSKTKESTVKWYFVDSKVEVKQHMYPILEKRLTKLKRINSTISRG